MQSTEVDYLDGEFKVNEEIPSTVEEIGAIIGPDAVVTEAVNNLRYRNKYPRVYKAVSKEVEAAHSFPRAVVSTKILKDGTKKEVKESENDHLRAFLFGRKDESGVITAPSPEENRTALGALFAKIGVAEPLYVKGERAGGGGKVSQGALDAANSFFAAGADKVEKVIEVIEGKMAGYKVGRDGDDQATPESLARGIQALGKFQQKQAELAAVAALQAA